MTLPPEAGANFLSLALETSPSAISITRVRDGLYITVNRGFADVSGWSQDEVIGRTSLDLDIWFDADERRRFVDKLLRDGSVRNALCRFRRRSGEVFYGHMSGSLFDWNGERHIFAVTQDISEIVHAQQQAEITEARLRSLISHIPHGVREIDLSGTILLENPAHAHLFGYAHGELVGTNCLGLVVDPAEAEDLAAFLDDFDPATSPTSGHYTSDMRRKDGALVRVRVDWSMQTVPGVPPSLISVLTDLTPTVQAQADLRRSVDELTRSNGELERYAYIAAHDLREPIRTVTSYAQLLRRRLGRDGVLEGETAELFEYLETGARRMSAVVDDLLAYSRLQSQTAPFEPVDLDEVMTAVRNNLARTIAELEAEVGAEARLPTVIADRPQMIQLFQNLVSNALRYQPLVPGHVPRVVVTPRRQGAGWAVAVRDNGIGIEDRYFDRIFTLFQRLHSQRDYPGTGVGLAICKRVTERHGGTITVESEPGRGSVFTVWLPDSPPDTGRRHDETVFA